MRDPVFGFSGAPFASAPDPRCWVPAAGQQQAAESLVQCLESGRGIAILTAAAGTGKSLLCQRIAEALQQEYRVAYLSAGRFEEITSLLQAVLFELGWPYHGLTTQELRLQLTTALREIRREARAAVLILDEAHSCSEDVLEEVRAATNHCADGRPLLRVLLSGQYALEELLTSPRLDALNQRIGCHVSLEPLTRSESADYIAYRLQRAGAEMQDVVDAQAVQTICYAAGGNPRCLNRLCDRSFELAARAGRKPLDDATVRIALEELKRLPLLWNDPPPVEAARDESRAAEVKPTTATASAAKPSPEIPVTASGDAAVFEFGADDFPQTGSTSGPTPTPATPPLPQRPPAKTTGVAVSSEPAKPAEPREEPGWTPVEPTTTTRREPTVTAPDVRFATHPGRESARIQAAKTAPASPAKPLPMQEETVEDHYAALVAEQRRQPPPVARPKIGEPASPRRARQPVEPASADEAIDALLAVVSDAIKDDEPDDGKAAVPLPRRDEREPVRFHSIEDYLRSARQDAVRTDSHEPHPAPTALAPAAHRESRDPDLYARLRRMRGDR